MKKRILTAFAFTTVIAAAGLWVSTSAQADDPKPCSGKAKMAQVKKACEKGGIPEAKKLMKGWTKKMKADDGKTNCKSCHTELKTYENKPNAVKDLKAFLKK